MFVIHDLKIRWPKRRSDWYTGKKFEKFQTYTKAPNSGSTSYTNLSTCRLGVGVEFWDVDDTWSVEPEDVRSSSVKVSTVSVLRPDLSPLDSTGWWGSGVGFIDWGVGVVKDVERGEGVCSASASLSHSPRIGTLDFRLVRKAIFSLKYTKN